MKREKFERICGFLVLIAGILFSGLLKAGPVLYVATGPANDIVKIDLKTQEIIGVIDELENAHGLAGHPSTEYLVAGSMSRAGDKAPAKPAAVSEAEHKAHHAAEKSANTGKGQVSYVSIVHPRHGHVMNRIKVSGITHHTAVSPNGQHAIAVHSTLGSISVIDLDSMKVTKEIETGQIPNYAVFTSDGGSLYVSNAGSGNVTEIDASMWAVVRRIAVGKGPEHLALSPDDKTLYVLNGVSGTVSMVDTRRGLQTDEIKVGKSPHGLAASPDGKWLFVSLKGENSLLKINLGDGNRQMLSLSPKPYHLEYVKFTNRLYISSRGKPLIWVIDPNRLRVEKEITLSRGIAHQMVVSEEQ